ncbi:MAG: hypothetical protein AAGF47_02930 [Planctomycetota bacterium]
MKRRFGKQEAVAAVLILGSAAWYWHRAPTPPIVFAGGAAATDQNADALESPDDR